ncbi:MAG: fused MFS/spermidine synthase [Chloroflexota bacterium]|nr:fused MFS/spermidine synthase [Chloroflexota bacterium]
MKKNYLYITVFFSGMTALAVELSASRLIGNVYGSSNLVWASVIGLILIYLTAGYWLGGKIADRYPSYRTFYGILMWGSLSVGLVPMISRPILRITSTAFDQLQIAVLAGAFITILLLFVIPVTLIGMVSPFAMKLALKDPKSAGKVSGKLSAISTIGSFIGTFLPVLVLIPLIGTYRTFLFFGSLLMVIAIIGYFITVDIKSWLRFSWMPIIMIFLWLFGTRGVDKMTNNMIYETESSYNYIQVIEQNSYRYLRLNEGQGIHSVYHPNELYYYGPWSLALVAPFFNAFPHSLDSVERMAILGLAGGTTARQASAVFDEILIDGFEIDPKIVEVGNQFFKMNQPNLSVYIQDGRWGLAHSDQMYDVISVDAYRPPYIPWHLTTVEFFTIVSEHLTEDGALAINIGRSPLDRTIVNDLSTTVGQVFPTTFIMDIPDSFNSILFATKQPGSWENIQLNFKMLSEMNIEPLLLEAMEMTIANQQSAPKTTQVYTDDRAPIEWLTNKIVVDFFLSGGTEGFQ